MTHNAKCQAVAELAEAEIANWKLRWPEHCRACSGSGGFQSTYDPSPPGVSLSAGYMIDFDPCPECVEKGRCPRCTKAAWNLDREGDSGPCPHCGWDQGKGVDDVCLGEPECSCWADEAPMEVQ